MLKILLIFVIIALVFITINRMVYKNKKQMGGVIGSFDITGFMNDQKGLKLITKPEYIMLPMDVTTIINQIQCHDKSLNIPLEAKPYLYAIFLDIIIAAIWEKKGKGQGFLYPNIRFPPRVLSLPITTKTTLPPPPILFSSSKTFKTYSPYTTHPAMILYNDTVDLNATRTHMYVERYKTPTHIVINDQNDLNDRMFKSSLYKLLIYEKDETTDRVRSTFVHEFFDKGHNWIIPAYDLLGIVQKMTNFGCFHTLFSVGEVLIVFARYFPTVVITRSKTLTSDDERSIMCQFNYISSIYGKLHEFSSSRQFVIRLMKNYMKNKITYGLYETYSHIFKFIFYLGITFTNVMPKILLNSVIFPRKMYPNNMYYGLQNWSIVEPVIPFKEYITKNPGRIKDAIQSLIKNMFILISICHINQFVIMDHGSNNYGVRADFGYGINVVYTNLDLHYVGISVDDMTSLRSSDPLPPVNVPHRRIYSKDGGKNVNSNWYLEDIENFVTETIILIETLLHGIHHEYNSEIIYNSDDDTKSKIPKNSIYIKPMMEFFNDHVHQSPNTQFAVIECMNYLQNIVSNSIGFMDEKPGLIYNAPYKRFSQEQIEQTIDKHVWETLYGSTPSSSINMMVEWYSPLSTFNIDPKVFQSQT